MTRQRTRDTKAEHRAWQDRLVSAVPQRTRDHLREWRLVTRPYAEAHYPGARTFGEFPFRSGRDLRTPRAIDGIVFKASGRRKSAAPEPRRWSQLDGAERRYWKQQVAGANVASLQSKVERLGLSVLGQALLSAFVLRHDFAAGAVESLALCTADDPDLASVIERLPFSEWVKRDVVAGLPPARPAPEYTRDPDVLKSPRARKLGSLQRLEKFRVNAHQELEVLFVEGLEPVDSPRDLTGRRVVVVHTCRKVHLSLLGHVIFGPELLRPYHPASLESWAFVREDDPVLSRHVSPLFEHIRIIEV
jgi:hypothetical protein